MIGQKEQAVLQLLERALFGAAPALSPEVPLEDVFQEAVAQSVFPLVYASLSAGELETLSSEAQARWKNQLLQYVLKNQRLLHEQEKVMSLLSGQGIPFVILKGSSCAVYYPDPFLRVTGDIDLLTPPGEQRRAVEVLQEDGYSGVLTEAHHCHYTIHKNKIAVEVHREPNGLHIIEDAAVGEKVRRFFADALDAVQTVDGFPVLQDRHQMVVLLLHKLEHFLAGGLGLRQLCDWAVFVEKRMTPELWQEMEPFLASVGLRTFTLAVTRSCIDHLGLPRQCAPWALECQPDLSGRVMERIVQNGNFGRKNRVFGERFFVDAHSKNRIASMFKVLAAACRTHWPVCGRYPVLMVAAPFVVLVKYLNLLRQGKRERFRPLKVYRQSGSKQQLYRELKPFVAERER